MKAAPVRGGFFDGPVMTKFNGVEGMNLKQIIFVWVPVLLSAVGVFRFLLFLKIPSAVVGLVGGDLFYSVFLDLFSLVIFSTFVARLAIFLARDAVYLPIRVIFVNLTSVIVVRGRGNFRRVFFKLFRMLRFFIDKSYSLILTKPNHVSLFMGLVYYFYVRWSVFYPGGFYLLFLVFNFTHMDNDVLYLGGRMRVRKDKVLRIANLDIIKHFGYAVSVLLVVASLARIEGDYLVYNIRDVELNGEIVSAVIVTPSYVVSYETEAGTWTVEPFLGPLKVRSE